jgi:hypothetical protein
MKNAGKDRQTKTKKNVREEKQGDRAFSPVSGSWINSPGQMALGAAKQSGALLLFVGVSRSAAALALAGVLTLTTVVAALAAALALALVLTGTVMGLGAVRAFATVLALAAVLGFFAGRGGCAGFCGNSFDGEGTGIKTGDSGGHKNCTCGFIHFDFLFWVLIPPNQHHASRTERKRKLGIVLMRAE